MLVKNKSYLTNLLKLLDLISNMVDQGFPVDIIYLDFQKAFDKLRHRKLLLILKLHGIRGRVLSWIADWLKVEGR